MLFTVRGNQEQREFIHFLRPMPKNSSLSYLCRSLMKCPSGNYSAG
jgi:hypothetical protein